MRQQVVPTADRAADALPVDIALRDAVAERHASGAQGGSGYPNEPSSAAELEHLLALHEVGVATKPDAQPDTRVPDSTAKATIGVTDLLNVSQSAPFLAL